MKRFIIPLVLLIAATSCYKIPVSNFGFDSNIDKGGNEISIMAVDQYSDFVYLTGSVTLETGQLQLTLQQPGGGQAYDTLFQSPGTLQINQTFDASSGLWKLQYKSIEGTGSIHLNLNY